MKYVKKEIGELKYIMEDWKECTIQEVTTYKKGFAFKLDDYKNSGIRIVKVSNLNQDLYDETKYVYLEPSELNKYEDVSLKYFDIVISTVGSWPNNPNSVVGKVTKIPRYLEGSLLNQNAVIFRANKFIRQDFLYYLLKDEKFFNYITGTAQGSASQASIKLVDIMNFSFNLPPLPTQQKIAQILSSLDDKIELNNKINANLEQQAQALFKSWFVDNSEQTKTIGDYISPKRGKNLLSKDALSGDVPVVAGGLEPATYHNEANTKEPVLTISSSGANAGFVNLWNIPVWSSDSSYIDSTMTDDVYFWYIMLKTRQKEIFDSQTGSAQPHIYPQHIQVLPVSELDMDKVHNFNKLIEPMFKTIGENKKENIRLSSIRDTLLPKLMNGEIEI